VSAARFDPVGPLRGTLRPPPDKSISHRAAILAAMGEGRTSVGCYLDAADTRATVAAIRAAGAEVEEAPVGTDALDLRITGVGLRGAGARWAGPGEVPIDVGNAGTLLRVLPGWLAGRERGRWVLDGDESIRRRPVDRVAEPLRAMGAEVSCRDSRLPPLRVAGRPLRGADHRLAVASAQVKSCLLLAGLAADGETTITEPAPSRDHTERMLRASGVALEVEALRTIAGVGGPPARRIAVRPVERLELGAIEVPGDFSSGSFFLVAATLVPGSEVRIEGVGLNPTRIGLLGILARMGADIAVEERAGDGPEPIGAVDARHAPLVGTRVHPEEVAVAIDELPLVALAACFAEGETAVAGAEELRRKESDRIAAVADGLRGLGADIEATADGFAIHGTRSLRGGTIDSRGDHRLAMLGAIAGLASREGVQVEGFDSVAVSYPSFERDLASLIRPP
jgi:3-phosphoshikimate 1-carboxyvinyltransferase